MDGYLAVNGVIVAEIHGYSGGELPQGQTFIPKGTPGAAVGQIAPDYRHIRLAQLAARRYTSETAGLVINSVRYQTDREGQLTMISAIRMLEEREMRSESTSTVWKAMNGDFVPVDLDSLIEIAYRVGKYVQSCFTHEAQLAQMILLASDPGDVDINSGWPE